MTDFRFDDIVDSTVMLGQEGKYIKSVCKSCSTQYKVTRNEFSRDTLNGSSYIPSSVTINMLKYVSKMRAWNCCHENDKPIDGLPEKVDSSMIRFK